jgi:glycosyltransferase involved in cell wall biosynthesis
MKAQYVMEESQTIDPVPEGVPRPLWSVMIPVYNRTKYVKQAVESVLVQDPGPEKMQVCIVDNSTDLVDWPSKLSPESLKRIEIFKQPVSVSVNENWNTCIRKAKGHFVHILHDDDYVAEGFYHKLESAFAENPDVHLIACRCFHFNDEGVILSVTPRVEAMKTKTNTLEGIYPGNPLRCPGVVVKRSLYESIGGFSPAYRLALDHEMWGRAIAFGKGIVLDDVLAFYREGDRPHHEHWRSDVALKDKEACLQQLSSYDPTLDVEGERSLLLNLARSSEVKFRNEGDRGAAKINRAYWKKKATFKETLSFYKDDIWANTKDFLSGWLKRG